jgi:hypothetical protein
MEEEAITAWQMLLDEKQKKGYQTRLSKYNNFGYILTSLFMDSSRFKNRLELIEKRC